MRKRNFTLADYLEAAATEKAKGAFMWVAPDIWNSRARLSDFEVVTGFFPPADGKGSVPADDAEDAAVPEKF